LTASTISPGHATKGNRGEVKSLVLEIVFYGFLVYVFFLAADRYGDIWSYQKPSILIFIFHWIFLYVHEGGHFLFSFFGRTLSILGGSFWQVMFPFLSFLIALRDSPRIAPFPMFLTGFNLMAVSLYMRDAPSRRLPLLGGDKGRHDWGNLFRQWDMLDSAVDVADWTYWIGIISCVASIGVGLFLAGKSYYRPSMPASGKISTSLHDLVKKQETSITNGDAESSPNKPAGSHPANNDPWGL